MHFSPPWAHCQNCIGLVGPMRPNVRKTAVKNEQFHERERPRRIVSRTASRNGFSAFLTEMSSDFHVTETSRPRYLRRARLQNQLFLKHLCTKSVRSAKCSVDGSVETARNRCAHRIKGRQKRLDLSMRCEAWLVTTYPRNQPTVDPVSGFSNELCGAPS